MAVLLSFRNVSLFKDEPFGLSNITFDIERHRKYHLITKGEEQLNTLAGLMEGRYRKQSGYIERDSKLFIQSDRLLMGDKIYQETAGKWLAVRSEFFRFGNKTRSKFGFIQQLNARYLLDYPIYKLQGNDRIKFALLALAFQETGIILISKLPTLDLNDLFNDFLHRIIKDTNTTVCLLSYGNDPTTLNNKGIPTQTEIITYQI